MGGGVNNVGDLDITASLIDGNAANGAGGVNSSKVLRVVNSTISNNIANFSGGGLYNLNGYAEIEGSTISGNTALQLNGAGVITVQFDAGLAQTTITNSTIANNENESGFPAAALLVIAQGANTQALATTRNSLYANNLPDNMGITVALGGLSATISDQGFNLSTDDSSEFLSPGANNANAALGPLTLNGGPVPTHALLPSSDALDAGSGEGAWFIFDQRGRGFARTTEQDVENAPGGDGTDVGAQEQQLFVDELFSDRFED
ncbi:MAG: choice-of-anchor Q domain-containing protein [Wenzhouxiangella sp.]|nr:choice-of-anchor Q domain-containing protein [Wenzhouxiangella sp.]